MGVPGDHITQEFEVGECMKLVKIAAVLSMFFVAACAGTEQKADEAPAAAAAPAEAAPAAPAEAPAASTATAQ